MTGPKKPMRKLYDPFRISILKIDAALSSKTKLHDVTSQKVAIFKKITNQTKPARSTTVGHVRFKLRDNISTLK